MTIRPGPIHVREIMDALTVLGGEARAKDIKDQVTAMLGGQPTHYGREHSYRETIQAIIEKHCPQSPNFGGTEVFERTARGRYRLLGYTIRRMPNAPAEFTQPGDTQPNQTQPDEPYAGTAPLQPAFQLSTVLRVIRDSALARELKQLHDGICQITPCAAELRLQDGTRYAEAHHLHPLGENGPDIRDNMIVVCPNHHALLDYAALQLSPNVIRNHNKHRVGESFLNYHNVRVRMAATTTTVNRL